MSGVFDGEPSVIVITCSAGIGPFLADEVRGLGFRVAWESSYAVETEGTLADCMTLNMKLRTAHRVLYTLDRFRARNANNLYNSLVEIPWERYIQPDGYFSVDRTVENTTILDTRYASLKVKDAVVDRLREKFGRRPDSGNERDQACLFLHWVDDRASIYIDTTGESLSFRGYRLESSDAPMRESLAAALVKATGWNGRTNFLNPMCGGGTIAIEALWIAQNRAPALTRGNFAFMHLACYEPSLWTKVKADAVKAYEPDKTIPCEIIASDIDPRMVEATLANAQAAGAEGRIRCEVADVAMSPVPETTERGVILVNPPYGDRMGDPMLLRDTYADIGVFLEDNASSYDGFIFTGSPEIAEIAGIVAEDRGSFYSGRIECRLLANPALTPDARAMYRRRSSK